MAEPLTDAEYDHIERRLRADVESARKALNQAQANFDRICKELRNLHIDRQVARHGDAVQGA